MDLCTGPGVHVLKASGVEANFRYVGTHPTCLDSHTFSLALRRHRVSGAVTGRRLSLPQKKVASAKGANYVSPFSPMLKRRSRPVCRHRTRLDGPSIKPSINPRPHLGGGDATPPRQFFLAARNIFFAIDV